MESAVERIIKEHRKPHLVNVRSGDTVRVHQKIKEGNKERVQVFQGLVIKTSNKNSHLARITVRRIASGIGVEKSFLINSPLVTRIEVTRRSKVRRNYLSYMRNLTGKSARLSSLDFDRRAVNDIPEDEVKLEKAEKQVDEKKEEPESKDESEESADDTKTETKEGPEKSDKETEKTA